MTTPTPFPAHEALKSQPSANLFSRVIDEATITDHVNDVPTLLAEFTQLQTLASELASTTKVYFDGYMQDEADDVEHCICGEEQHEAAKAVKQSLQKYRALMGGDDAIKQ